MRTLSVLKSVVVLMVLSGLCCGCRRRDSDRDRGRGPTVSVNESAISRTEQHESFAPIVRKVAPTVVNIFSTKTVKNPLTQLMPFYNDPFFRQFFGDRFEGHGKQPSTLKEQSLGSGVIVSKDGYVLTNNHVVEAAEDIRVTLEKGSEDYSARIVGRDPKTDLAVVKIEAGDLPFITLGDSENVQVGDLVLALGNPFGVGQTVTNGIISALKRGGLGMEDYEDFIQTDAAINPGNSGGPLVDVEGRLIGVNTAILSQSGGSMGIGFAIPVNVARHVMAELIEHGKVVRGSLGVSIQDLPGSLAKQFNAPKAEGALIGNVLPNSAAAEAGLQSGDIVTEFNHKPVRRSRDLQLMVAALAPGAKVEIKVLRNGTEKTVPVTLKESTTERRNAEPVRPGGEGGDTLKGVVIADIDRTMRAKLDLPEGLKGAVITEIDADSPAYAAGLRPGDVIQEINHVPVANTDEVMTADQKAHGKRMLIRYWRHEISGYVVLNPGRNP